MSNIFDSMAARKQDDSAGTKDQADQVQRASQCSEQKDESDSPQGSLATSPAIKEVTQQLLKNGYLEETRKRDLFRRAVLHQDAINAALEPLDLALRVDAHRGVAFLKIAAVVAIVDNTDNADSTDEATVTHDGAWSHPLVRRQRLTLEQSILLAILRQMFVMHEQESGVGESSATVAVDELMPHFLTYFDDSGSDAKNESRLLNLLDHLKSHGIVSEVDKKQEVTIRPLIAHVANPESLAALLQTLIQQQSAGSTGATQTIASPPQGADDE